MISKAILSIARFAARWTPASVQKFLFRIKPLNLLTRYIMNKIAPSGQMQFVVAGGSLAGRKLSLIYGIEKNYWLGDHDLNFQYAFGDLLNPGMVVYDVGANIGFHTLILADIVTLSGHVYAFEALPKSIKRLQANLTLNSEINNITIIPKAVTDATKTTNFLVHESLSGGKVETTAGFPGEPFIGKVEVETISLDDFVYVDGNTPPQAIKIDIQGGEVLALPGMSHLLQEEKPIVFIELHGKEAQKFCWDFLAAAGYKFHQLSSGYPLMPNLVTNNRSLDVIAIPAT